MNIAGIFGIAEIEGGLESTGVAAGEQDDEVETPEQVQVGNASVRVKLATAEWGTEDWISRCWTSASQFEH